MLQECDLFPDYFTDMCRQPGPRVSKGAQAQPLGLNWKTIQKVSVSDTIMPGVLFRC
jgi:hypothetical protein